MILPCTSRPQSCLLRRATLDLCVGSRVKANPAVHGFLGKHTSTSTRRECIFELVPQILPCLVPPLVALLHPLEVEHDGAERHPEDDGDGHEGDEAGRAAQDDDGDALAGGRVVEGVAGGAGRPGAPRAHAAAGLRVPHPTRLQAARAGRLVGAAALARGRVVELKERAKLLVALFSHEPRHSGPTGYHQRMHYDALISYV